MGLEDSGSSGGRGPCIRVSARRTVLGCSNVVVLVALVAVKEYQAIPLLRWTVSRFLTRWNRRAAAAAAVGVEKQEERCVFSWKAKGEEDEEA